MSVGLIQTSEALMKTIVAYLRVSTSQQGRSGLGIEAQPEALKGFASGEGFKIVAEYIEVETGKVSRTQTRPAWLRLTGVKGRGILNALHALG